MRRPSFRIFFKTQPILVWLSNLHQEQASQGLTISTETNSKCCYNKAISKKLQRSPQTLLEDFCEPQRQSNASRMLVKELANFRSFYSISVCFLIKAS